MTVADLDVPDPPASQQPQAGRATYVLEMILAWKLEPATFSFGRCVPFINHGLSSGHVAIVEQGQT